jgi:hypothetical protein
MRKCGFDDIDKALLEWLKVERDVSFPINGLILKICIKNQELLSFLVFNTSAMVT